MHERDLVGKTYDYFCRAALPAYARETEDLLSLLSLAGSGEYPTRDFGYLAPSVFKEGYATVVIDDGGGTVEEGGGAMAEGDEEAAAEAEGDEPEDGGAAHHAQKKRKVVLLSEEIVKKATILANAIMSNTDTKRGVLVKNESGDWKEDPQLSVLKGWSVTNVKSPEKKEVPVLNVTEGSRTYKIGEQTIELSPEAAAIFGMSFKELARVIQRILTSLPKRQKPPTSRFKTTAQQAAGAAAAARKHQQRRALRVPLRKPSIMPTFSHGRIRRVGQPRQHSGRERQEDRNADEDRQGAGDDHRRASHPARERRGPQLLPAGGHPREHHRRPRRHGQKHPPVQEGGEGRERLWPRGPAPDRGMR